MGQQRMAMIEELKNHEDQMGLYYKTTVSKLRFQTQPPDPETVPLADFRKAERERVLSFLERSSQKVLTVGGVSETNKTFTAKQLTAQRPEAGFYDLALIPFGKAIAESWRPEQYVAEMAAAADRLHSSPDEMTTLFLDESMPLCTMQSIQGIAVDLVRAMMDRFDKVILLGGGNHHLGLEQAAMLLCLARQVEFGAPTSMEFPLKTLSVRQAAELLTITQPERYPSLEAAMVIAKLYLKYFRLPRRVIQSDIGQFKQHTRNAWVNPPGWHQPDFSYNAHRASLLQEYMPKECVTRAFPLQRDIVGTYLAAQQEEIR